MHNAAISAAKLQKYCRIAKGIDKITQILRRFFSQNAEIRQIVPHWHHVSQNVYHQHRNDIFLNIQNCFRSIGILSHILQANHFR